MISYNKITVPFIYQYKYMELNPLDIITINDIQDVRVEYTPYIIKTYALWIH